jgi:hypothetical protein
MPPVRENLYFYSLIVTGPLVLLWSLHELGLVAFGDHIQSGLKIGLALVVVALYPAVLRQHERRLVVLEKQSSQGGSGNAAAENDQATERSSLDR